jgi:hypothetical protein
MADSVPFSGKTHGRRAADAGAARQEMPSATRDYSRKRREAEAPWRMKKRSFQQLRNLCLEQIEWFRGHLESGDEVFL